MNNDFIFQSNLWNLNGFQVDVLFLFTKHDFQLMGLFHFFPIIESSIEGELYTVLLNFF